MHTEDAGLKQQEEAHDEEEHPVLDPNGQPFRAQTSMQDLTRGVDMEGETPLEAHKEDHPTPNRPGGRVGP